MARDASSGFRETEVEAGICGFGTGLDAGFGFGEFDGVVPRVSGGENGGEKLLEFLAADGVLIDFEQ